MPHQYGNHEQIGMALTRYRRVTESDIVNEYKNVIPAQAGILQRDACQLL
jgi:hypothetical protein